MGYSTGIITNFYLQQGTKCEISAVTRPKIERILDISISRGIFGRIKPGASITDPAATANGICTETINTVGVGKIESIPYIIQVKYSIIARFVACSFNINLYCSALAG